MSENDSHVTPRAKLQQSSVARGFERSRRDYSAPVKQPSAPAKTRCGACSPAQGSRAQSLPLSPHSLDKTKSQEPEKMGSSDGRQSQQEPPLSKRLILAHEDKQLAFLGAARRIEG